MNVLSERDAQRVQHVQSLQGCRMDHRTVIILAGIRFRRVNQTSYKEEVEQAEQSGSIVNNRWEQGIAA